MNSKIRAALTLLPLLLSSFSPLPAQLSRARSDFDRLRSLVSEIQPDRDESRLESSANSLQDSANSAASSLSELGKNLASASGPFSSERAEVANMANAVRKSLSIVSKLGKDLVDHIKSKSRWSTVDDYKKELVNRCQDVRMEFERDYKEWEALTRKIEDTRRWLQDRLKEATAMRDNAAKPAEALEQVEDQILARMEALTERFKSAFNTWTSAVSNTYSARSKENDAFKRWMEAVRSGDANQFSDKVKSLANAWLSAEEEQLAAARTEFEAFTNMDRIADERKRLSSELARAMQDIRAFAKEATSDTINKRWADFDQWTREFEREMGR